MQKRAKISFRNLSDGAKSPTLVVSDYVFDTEHEDSSVSWLFRKLDRYENGSSFMSDSSNVRCEGDESQPLVYERRSQFLLKKIMHARRNSSRKTQMKHALRMFGVLKITNSNMMAIVLGKKMGSINRKLL